MLLFHAERILRLLRTISSSVGSLSGVCAGVPEALTALRALGTGSR